jgi:hypothetical protein
MGKRGFFKKLPPGRRLMKPRIPRKSRRYPVSLEVKELNGQPGAETRILDLSAQGARLETSALLPLRELVDFTFTYPGDLVPIRLGGQVVWTRPSPAAPGRYLVGLRLLQSCWDLIQLTRRLESLADDH